MANVNKLLENRIDLETYEQKFGELPACLKQGPTNTEDGHAEDESEYSSSSEEPSQSEEKDQVVSLATHSNPLKEPDINFFDQGFPSNNRLPVPSFMSLSQ